MFKIFLSIKISTTIENCISTTNRQNIKILKNATSSFDMQQQNNPTSDDEIQVISNNTKPLTKISKITGEKKQLHMRDKNKIQRTFYWHLTEGYKTQENIEIYTNVRKRPY